MMEVQTVTTPEPRMPNTNSPVVVVPGTASDLHDEYDELPPEAVWTIALRRRYERITLRPLNAPIRGRPTPQTGIVCT